MIVVDVVHADHAVPTEIVACFLNLIGGVKVALSVLYVRLHQGHEEPPLSSSRLGLELHRRAFHLVALTVSRLHHKAFLIGWGHIVKQQRHEFDFDIAQLALFQRSFLIQVILLCYWI